MALFWTGAAIGQGFTNLHNFVFTNGTFPTASLILSGNTLYGTAQNYGGGTGGGYGSVFKMGTDGSNFMVLHIFSGGTDGGNINCSLVLANDMLYGTAAFGGASNYGCVFGISTDGTGLTNLYSFSPLSADSPGTNNDGAYPIGGLVLVGDTLYGTANAGGTTGWGTVFAVSISGTGFTNLHSLGPGDGQFPQQGVIVSGSTLYGATPFGKLFATSTNGTGFTNFFTFSGPLLTNSGGSRPLGSLLLSGNTLFGTASYGGDAGNGTIFKVNTDGSDFSVLHIFSAMSGTASTNNDGARPQAELILVNRALYGTAKNGGGAGNGTVFRLNTDGTGFSTLYSFSATDALTGTNTDGAHPTSGLVFSNGILYGTASSGGTAGYGTVFSLLVPPTLGIQRSGTDAILTWPTNLPGFNLQTATNLAPPINWSAVAGQYSVTNPIADKQRFFRLVHP
jgi:uncharacterized repeat protein (TIGR03803 family)